MERIDHTDVPRTTIVPHYYENTYAYCHTHSSDSVGTYIVHVYIYGDGKPKKMTLFLGRVDSITSYLIPTTAGCLTTHFLGNYAL